MGTEELVWLRAIPIERAGQRVRPIEVIDRTADLREGLAELGIE